MKYILVWQYMYEVNQLKVFFTALQFNFGERVNVILKTCTNILSISCSIGNGVDMCLSHMQLQYLGWTMIHSSLLANQTDSMSHVENPFYTNLYPTCIFHHISFLSFIMRLPPPSSSFEFRVHVEVIFEISLNRFYNKVVQK